MVSIIRSLSGCFLGSPTIQEEALDIDDVPNSTENLKKLIDDPNLTLETFACQLAECQSRNERGFFGELMCLTSQELVLVGKAEQAGIRKHEVPLTQVIERFKILCEDFTKNPSQVDLSIMLSALSVYLLIAYFCNLDPRFGQSHSRNQLESLDINVFLTAKGLDVLSDNSCEQLFDAWAFYRDITKLPQHREFADKVQIYLNEKQAEEGNTPSIQKLKAAFTVFNEIVKNYYQVGRFKHISFIQGIPV